LKRDKKGIKPENESALLFKGDLGGSNAIMQEVYSTHSLVKMGLSPLPVWILDNELLNFNFLVKQFPD
jgi:hypothetical protein